MSEPPRNTERPATEGTTADDAAPALPAGDPLRFLDALLKQADEVSMLLQPDGKMTWGSSNAPRVFGVSAPELVDLSGIGLIHPDDRDRVIDNLSDLAEPGKVIRTQFRIVLDGTVRWMAATVTNCADEPGVESLVGNFRDITAQKESEIAVRLEATLLASAPQAITALDPDGVINYWNDAAETIYGWTAEEAIGRRTGDVVPVADGWANAGAAAAAANHEGRPWSYELRVVRKDGSVIPVMATATPLVDDHGVHLGTTVVSYDTTEQLRNQEIAARLAAIVETSHDAIFSTDLDGRITTWNEGAVQLYGYHEADVLGQHSRLLGMDVDRQTADRFDRARRGERAETVTTLGRRADGSSLHVSVSMSPIRTAAGEVIGVSVIAQDVTERVVAQEALAHQATHDARSGLANRRLFVERLEQSLERSKVTGHHTGVIFIDLDDFKLVNDQFGHIDGDQLLRKVGQRIDASVGAQDTVARLGGDEYVVACDGLDGHGALSAIVVRIREVLAVPFLIGDETRPIRASIGMALSGSVVHAEALIRNADVAMYAAKQAGGDRAELFDDALYARQKRRKEMAAEVDAALELGQFHTTFQPEVTLHDESLFGFEALARWTHPDRGPISPAEFIPIAEQSGAIIRLGHQVLRDACRAVAVWMAESPDRPVLVSVNLSPVQLADPGLHDAVRDAIASAGVAPSQICLEVTESALMEFTVAAEAMRGLKDIGVTIAIDDFGTGYSSLSRLKAFPVDFLKIDRSFVDGLGHDPDDEAIVAAVIGLADSLGVLVIAEGIETVTQFERLRELGCQYGQGYLWSPPVTEIEAAHCAMHEGPLPRSSA